MTSSENLSTIPNRESVLEKTKERESGLRTSKEVVQGWLARMKERSRYLVESAKEKVTKQTVGLALASVLASTPQEALAVQQNDDFPQNTAGISYEDKKQSSEHDDISDRLNEEFAKEAREDNERRRVEFWNGAHFKEKDKGTELTKDLYLGAMATATSASREQLEEVYTENKEEFDKQLEPISLKRGGDVKSAIDVSSSGVMVTFTGNLENIGDIPQSFKEKLSDIKKNPGKFIAEQLLGMAVSPVEKPVRNFIDEHDQTLKGE